MQSIQATNVLKSKPELSERIQVADQSCVGQDGIEKLFAQVAQQVDEAETQTELPQSLAKLDDSCHPEDQSTAVTGSITVSLQNSTEIAEQVLKSCAVDKAAMNLSGLVQEINADKSENLLILGDEPQIDRMPRSVFLKIELHKPEVMVIEGKIRVQPEQRVPNITQTQAHYHADIVQSLVIANQAQVAVNGPDTTPLPPSIGTIDATVLPAADQGIRTESLNKLMPQEAIRSEHKWGEQMVQTLRDQVQLQVNQKVQQATIRLDPPELGSLEIQISHEAGRLSVTINASHSDVARLIQQTSDRLRNELAQAQFSSVDVRTQSESNPGHQHSRQRQGDEPAEQIGIALSMEQSEADGMRTTATDILVTV